MTTEPDDALAAVERLRQAAFRPTELTPGLTVVGQYDLRAIRASHLNNTDAGRAFEISSSVVSRIRAGKAWAHVD
jgi:hypothetical protein